MRFALYTLFVPSQTAGASTVYFDLYNGSTGSLNVTSIEAIMDGSVAVTGLVTLEMFLTRTTAVGTGGTVATAEGTSLTAATITKLGQRALPDDVSARLTPTGGATAGAVIGVKHLHPEETSYSYLTEFLPTAPLIVPTGTGIRVVQGSVASVGEIGFNVNFY